MEPVTVTGQPGLEFSTGQYTGTGRNFLIFTSFSRKLIRYLSLMLEIISKSGCSAEYSIPSKLIVEHISYFMHQL